MGSLTNLGMAELGIVDSLATELLARNHQNLRHLRLGSELDLVKEYANNGYMDSNGTARFCLTETFAEIMQKKVAALKEPSTPVVRLKSLSLIGHDLYAFAKGLVEPEIDFNCLSILTLESCENLEAAFPLLGGLGDGRRKTKSALGLHTLAIRHENTSDDFLQGLEDFLVSLKPLAHLHVLLEGDYDGTIKMRKVLRVHGKSLRSLVWDERTGPRRDVHGDTTTFPDDHENLETVSKHCPGLKALGISLDWSDIACSEGNHKKVKRSLGHAFISC